MTRSEKSGYAYFLYVATTIVAAAGLYVAWLYVSSDKDFGYEIEWKFWNSPVLWPVLSFIGFFLQFFDWQHTSFKEGWVIKNDWGQEKFVENNDIISTLWGGCVFPLLAHLFFIPMIYGALLYYVIMAPLALVNALIPYLAALLSVAIVVVFFLMSKNFKWRSHPLVNLIIATTISLALIWALSLPASDTFSFNSSNASSKNVSQPEAIGHAFVTVKIANLRTGPGTGYDICQRADGGKLQMAAGEEVLVLADTGEWFKILTAGGGTAYIKKSLCTDIEYYNTDIIIEEQNCDVEEDDDDVEVEQSTPTFTTIYQSTEPVYCDGNYDSGNEDTAQFFSADLSGLNRNCFSLSFDYVPEAMGDVLVLSANWRILAVRLSDDNTVTIVTDNGRNAYTTDTHYALNEDNHLDIAYDNGTLTVNGSEQSATLNTEDGDNKLTSWNYSYGNAFKGTIANVVVKSLTVNDE